MQSVLAAFWVTDLKRLVSSLTHQCIICRNSRGHREVQKMSDLPADTIDPIPPFTNVGVDTFGPWQVLYSDEPKAVVLVQKDGQ